jgi:hypothetical protein
MGEGLIGFGSGDMYPVARPRLGRHHPPATDWTMTPDVRAISTKLVPA